MSRQLRLSWLALILAGICWIPSRPKASPPAAYRYVTGAELVFCHEDRVETRIYRSSEKITSLLNYLRLSKTIPGRVLEAPESQHRYRISLWFSDGSQTVYRLYGYNRRSRNDGPWQAVLPVHAQLIYPLFYYLPSDS